MNITTTNPQKDISIFKKIYHSFIKDNIIKLFKYISSIFVMIKEILSFGFKPKHTKVKTINDEIRTSQLLLTLLALLLVFRISFQEITGINSTNILQEMQTFSLLIVYLIGLYVFIIIGRLCSLLHKTSNIIVFDKLIMREYNFLVFISFFILLFNPKFNTVATMSAFSFIHIIYFLTIYYTTFSNSKFKFLSSIILSIFSLLYFSIYTTFVSVVITLEMQNT